MDMEPGSKQEDSGVVNITRAIEALSPWLNNPRRTIFKVELLVLFAAVLLLVQLILGSCRRRSHNCIIKYGLQASTAVMNPLIIYTLGTMQSSPIKNSSYPVWAGFLIMASAGTTAVRQYDFCGRFYNKYMKVLGEYLRDFFYAMMFILLMDPNNTYNLKTAWHLTGHPKESRTSSNCVMTLFGVIVVTKFYESLFYARSGYKEKRNLFITMKKSSRTRTQAAEHDSDPQSMNGYKYVVCDRMCGGGLITIDQIWDSCGNSADDGNALKDLCLSYSLSQRLRRQRYFGLVSAETSRPEDLDFVFKKLLPPAEEYFQRAFRIIEVELGFCYDFFFTKYYYTFFWANLLPVPFFQSLILLKIILILVVGVFAIRKSLVLETPNPIIEVHISKADYVITLLVLSIALLVESVKAAFYLASNWAQVSLACMHVKKCCREPKAYIFGKFIGILRWVTISQQLRNKIDQHSVIFPPKQQPDPVEVSDATKKAVARSLRSTYANNLTTHEEISARPQKKQDCFR